MILSVYVFTDKMDMQLPAAGLLQVQDAETGKTQWIDSSNAMIRYNYQQHFMKQSEDAKAGSGKREQNCCMCGLMTTT